MQALLNVYGVTSGNYQDILKAAQSNNPDLGQQSTAAQIIEGFVPGGSLSLRRVAVCTVRRRGPKRYCSTR
jgi:hypothetical protein